jgi:uracil-DNA glycosylase|tara:strand:+ start:3274 stop:3963 length:690 start_codon:yes stop_codon:yes gene_type:complete
MKKLEIDINNLRERINKTLDDSGWTPALAPFINGLSFDIILNNLVSMVEADKRFTPRFKDIFNAFKECPYNDIKVIVIGQDPYPQLGVADGIAFSCSNKGKAEKSLQYILKALNDKDGDVDLKRWSNQGVLLLNTAFTCEVNSIGSHINLWKPFAIYLFELLNRHHKNIPVIMMGKKAEDWEIYLSNQKIYKVAHPASAAYRGGLWDCKDVFNQVNEELKKQEKTCIEW